MDDVLDRERAAQGRPLPQGAQVHSGDDALATMAFDLDDGSWGQHEVAADEVVAPPHDPEALRGASIYAMAFLGGLLLGTAALAPWMTGAPSAHRAQPEGLLPVSSAAIGAAGDTQVDDAFRLIGSRPVDAIRRFHAVLETSPEHGQALLGLGTAHLSLGERRPAMRWLCAAATTSGRAAVVAQDALDREDLVCP